MKNPKVRRFLLPSFNPQDTKWGVMPAQTMCTAHINKGGIVGKIVYVDGICVFFEEKVGARDRETKAISIAHFLSLLTDASQMISLEHYKFFKENRYVDVKVYEGALRGLVILEVKEGRLPDFAGDGVNVTSHPDFTEEVMMKNPNATMRARDRIAYEMFKACIGAG
jgi:hypothetical protein